jgi:predicted transcriptional regulator
MAKRKTKAKRYAVQRHIEVRDAAISTQNINIIDVPQFLSKVNHRLYRQSRSYRCKINVTKPTTRGIVDVYALRDTWFLQKAYQMAKDTFDKNTTEERSGMSPKSVARWQDFRIDIHPKAGVTYNDLNPAIRDDTLTLQDLTIGEFELSLVHKENGTAMSFGLFDITNARWAIVNEYDRAANTDNSPEDEQGLDVSAYSGLDDDNQDGSREHLSKAGNAPPYDSNSLNGNKLFRKVGTIGGDNSQTGLTNKLTTGYFDAPLGAILLVTADSPGSIELEVQSGDYKGVHAETYIDVSKKFGHRRA